MSCEHTINTWGEVSLLSVPVSGTERLSNLPWVSTSAASRNHHWKPGITLEH